MLGIQGWPHWKRKELHSFPPLHEFETVEGEEEPTEWKEGSWTVDGFREVLLQMDDAVQTVVLGFGYDEDGNFVANSEHVYLKRRSEGEVDAEQAKAEQADTEQADTEQADAEQADAEKAEAEKADAEKAEAEKADAEQAEAEQADAEQADAEQADAEQAEAEQAEAEQADADQADAEKADAEQAEKEQADTEQADAEQAEAEQAGAEQAEAKQAEAKQADTEQADSDGEQEEPDWLADAGTRVDPMSEGRRPASVSDSSTETVAQLDVTTLKPIEGEGIAIVGVFPPSVWQGIVKGGCTLTTTGGKQVNAVYTNRKVQVDQFLLDLTSYCAVSRTYAVTRLRPHHLPSMRGDTGAALRLHRTRRALHDKR